MGEIGYGAYIYSIKKRVGGRLNENEPTGLRKRAAPVSQIRSVDPRHLNAHFGHHILEDPDAGRKKRAWCNNTVAGLNRSHEHRMDRRHATCRRAAVFCAFKQAEALLQHPHCGICISAVDVAWLLASHTGRLLIGTVVNKSGIEKEGL